MQHFQDYNDRRRHLARHHVSAFLASTWCTAFENSMSWIVGCRPSPFFGLLFALCASDIDSRLSQFLQGGSSTDFPRLSPCQLSSIDSQQRGTIMEEEKLTTQMASLQQDMTDAPLALMAGKSGPTHELNRDVRDTIGKIEHARVPAMEEADQLRLSRVKEMMKILEPVQALDYIIAAKKLSLLRSIVGRESKHASD